MAQKQATSWDDLEIAMKGLRDKAAALPAPPTPRDSWSEKVNLLNRTLEGMAEQARSESENEEAQRATERERADD